MAALAASNWPGLEQSETPHAVHSHSKQVVRHVRPYRNHPAVIQLNRALSLGIPLRDLFSAAIRCRRKTMEPLEPLPDSLADGVLVGALADFGCESDIESFWKDHESPWQRAISECEAIFQRRRLISLLQRISKLEERRQVLVMPAIVFPMLHPVLAVSSRELQMIVPPAKAWGESPPWPFGEDPAWVVAQVCGSLAVHFLGGTFSQLDHTRQALLQHAVIAVCLEREFDEAEGMAYMVRNRKELDLPQLPRVIGSIRDFLADPGNKPLIDLA
jgi:hypothetical protein